MEGGQDGKGKDGDGDEGGEGKEGRPLAPPLLVLPECAAYYWVVQEGEAVNCGDHDVVFVRLEAILGGHSFNEEEGEEEEEEVEAEQEGGTGRSLPMYSGYLRDEGIISAAGRANPPPAASA